MDTPQPNSHRVYITFSIPLKEINMLLSYIGSIISFATTVYLFK